MGRLKLLSVAGFIHVGNTQLIQVETRWHWVPILAIPQRPFGLYPLSHVHGNHLATIFDFRSTLTTALSSGRTS